MERHRLYTRYTLTIHVADRHKICGGGRNGISNKADVGILVGLLSFTISHGWTNPLVLTLYKTKGGDRSISIMSSISNTTLIVLLLLMQYHLATEISIGLVELPVTRNDSSRRTTSF